jgi:transcriptional regulator with XRE-family HTH domain
MPRPERDEAAERNLEQCAIVRTIGQRLREARELCNMSQLMAAERLGYSNSSKLAKVENSSDTCSVPLWLIVRAAKLYDVSVDFLFGLSDDWESDPAARNANAIHHFLLEARAREAAREIEALRRFGSRLDLIETATVELSDAMDWLFAVIIRFWELNKAEFEDMKGGATLVKALEKAEAASRSAKDKLRRLKADIGTEPRARGISLSGPTSINQVFSTNQ